MFNKFTRQVILNEAKYLCQDTIGTLLYKCGVPYKTNKVGGYTARGYGPLLQSGFFTYPAYVREHDSVRAWWVSVKSYWQGRIFAFKWLYKLAKIHYYVSHLKIDDAIRVYQQWRWKYRHATDDVITFLDSQLERVQEHLRKRRELGYLYATGDEKDIIIPQQEVVNG